jgi:hypothetical protein
MFKKRKKINWINKKLLVQDIRKGVKHLSDFTYCNYWGKSIASVEFIKTLKELIKEFHVYRVEMKNDTVNGYRMVLNTSEHTIVLYGLTSGYISKSTRNAYKILRLIGFSKEKASVIFEQSSFIIYNRRERKESKTIIQKIRKTIGL